jgi:hypothetical protein
MFARMPKTDRRTPTPARVDHRWFLAAITTSKYGSLRQLAPHLRNRQGRPMSHMSLVWLISGRRRMTVEDARRLADLLEQPFAEVCRRAGVDVHDLGDDVEARQREAARMVRTLLAFIDEHGLGERLPRRIRDAAERVSD